MTMGRITEATLVPLSLVVALFGGSFWLSTMYAKVEAHESSLKIVEHKQDKFQEEVIDRLARIETKLVNKR